MSDKQTPNEFYADRGLVRTSITLDEPTIAFLGDHAKALSDDETKVTQGEIVILLTQLLQEDQAVQAAFNQRFSAFRDDKIKARNELKEKKKKAKKLLLSGALDQILEKG
jgi:hypothetical protein